MAYEHKVFPVEQDRSTDAMVQKMEDQLDALGAEGWEAVSIDQHTIIAKRPTGTDSTSSG